MNDVTTVTTVGNFPVEDITHKPKRRQGDNIRLAQLNKTAGDSSEQSESVPTVVTIERAITFYERQATRSPELSVLYHQTAEWLRELMMTRNVKVTAAVREEMRGASE